MDKRVQKHHIFGILRKVKGLSGENEEVTHKSSGGQNTRKSTKIRQLQRVKAKRQRMTSGVDKTGVRTITSNIRKGRKESDSTDKTEHQRARIGIRRNAPIKRRKKRLKKPDRKKRNAQSTRLYKTEFKRYKLRKSHRERRPKQTPNRRAYSSYTSIQRRRRQSPKQP